MQIIMSSSLAKNTTVIVTQTVTSQLPLMQPTSSFPLWSIALITLSVLVVTSMMFIMIVLLCRILKERTNKHHTYNTRSRQGSIRLQGSVSLIKNQESLEVTNAHYHRQISTAILPDDNSESSMESDTVNQEQQAQAVPYSDGSGERELRRLGSSDESLHEVTEGEEDGIGGRTHMYDTSYENSGASQQHRSFSDQSETRGREYTHHSHSIDKIFQNNLSEIVSTVTEVSQQWRRETAAVNKNHDAAAVTVTLTFEDGSNLHDIPGFQDPELKGEDEDGGGLKVNAPPDIYSSQILSTVVNDEEEGGYGTEMATSMGMGNGSETPSSHGIDIILNTGSLPPQDFDCSLPESESTSLHQSKESQIENDNHRLTPEGAQEGIIQETTGGSIPSIALCQYDLQTNDEDVVYDQPIVKQGKTSLADDIKVPGIVDLTALFDDPGYTKGMMLAGNGGNPKDSAESQQSVPQRPPIQRLESSSGPKMQSLSVQMSRAPGMKSSIDSLALLDYDDSELNELDPMIASCLRSPILSDTDDEIAISEV